jgi:PAS domain S-box-containing protein
LKNPFQRQQGLREEAQTLELLNQVGIAVAAELDMQRVVDVVTDAATKLSGAAFGSFFYNEMNESGEAYSLYSLSDETRGTVARFPVPRGRQVLAAAFHGEAIVRCADIEEDPRYGADRAPFGVPEGELPVRSYLAASVSSRSGEVLGGLFLGHPEPGVFDERAERIVAAIAVQAGIAIDKARLYRAAQDEIERRKRIEASLRESEETLEAKVVERTAQLVASNALLITEAEERQEAEDRFGLLVGGIVDYAIYMLGPNGVITNWNPGAERIKGYSGDEIIGRNFSVFFTEEDRKANLPAAALQKAAVEGKFEAEGWRVRKDGSRFWANAVIDAIRDKNGRLLGFAKITRDITERRNVAIALQRAQEQLAQAQKMEGIGHLTGGVAHDFNNLLAIIMGNLEMLQRALQLQNADPARLARAADNAMRGAQRAAALTQRLLAFSRQQPLDPKVVEIGKLVTGMSDLLRRSIGEQVSIETILAGGLWRVQVDPNQLEVAILNLAVNARDAMPDGGSLTIETANAYLDQDYSAAEAEVIPGQYVVISVTDSGCGMPRDVVARAFEPFYTTKDVGHGTGLGLSQIYGFVKQSGGHVKIYSEVGRGTTVKIYLPRFHAVEERVADVDAIGAPVRSASGETILVVEDDEDLRANTKEILRELGYRTLEAGTGGDALKLLQTHPETQLLFSDVVLPGGMNGRQLADEARRRRSCLKILFTTGYARDTIVHEGRLDAGVQLITKPFTYAALASKIREVLDTGSVAARILLVDDEPLITKVATEYLEEFGFKVDTAESATEAIDKLKLGNGGIEAAIIDLGLPDRKGDILVAEVRALYPLLPIVIASGCVDEELRVRFETDERISFLPKPYSAAQMRTLLTSLLARI